MFSPKVMDIHEPNVSFEYDHVKLENHKAIGGFTISEESNYFPMSSPPELNLTLIVTLEDSELEPCVQRNVFDDLDIQYNYFLRWIVDKSFHALVEENRYQKPGFFCLGGILTKTMSTPFEVTDHSWTLYATKFRGTIYLLDGMDESDDQNLVSNVSHSFTYILNQSRHQTYSFNQFKLGSHQILSLNEIVGRSAPREYVVASLKPCPQRITSTYALNLWARSAVAGANTTILGCQKADKLCHIDILKTDKIAREFEWRPQPCLDFQDRLLTFIANNFEESEDDFVLKRVSWKCGYKQVQISNANEQKNIRHKILPDWFIRKVQNPRPTAEIKSPVRNAPNPVTIFVGNLPFWAEKHDLEKLFARNGSKIDIRFPKEYIEPGESSAKPYCFVTFDDNMVGEFFLKMENVEIVEKSGKTRILHLERSNSPYYSSKPKSPLGRSAMKHLVGPNSKRK